MIGCVAIGVRYTMSSIEYMSLASDPFIRTVSSSDVH
jgi:hypothetical protein